MDLSKQLLKRKWKPVITPEGKLYTGWDGVFNYEKMLTGEPHKIWEMELRPVTFSRGRSAADIIFEDRDGTKYDMKLGSTMKLLKALFAEEFELVDGYVFARVVQVKKGANIGIEVVVDEAT